jgi:hypothetical protein
MHNLAATQVRAPPPAAPEQRPHAAPPEQRQARDRRRRQHRRSMRAELTRIVAQKPIRERVTELTGSMLLATLVAAVASLGILLLFFGELSAPQYAWLFAVSTLGSWLVMIPAKLYEGRLEDHSPKRFTQLLLGMLLGFAAWGLAESLMLEVPFKPDYNFDSPLVGELMNVDRDTFRRATHVPLAMFVGYFGFLLMGLRWWTQAEWTRYTRLSIWAIAVCVTIAMLLQLFWWFPQPAGAMVAAVMAVSIQLSSPWLSLGSRREIMQKLHAA